MRKKEESIMWKFNGLCIFLVIGVVEAKPQSFQVNPITTRIVSNDIVDLIDQIFNENNGNGINNEKRTDDGCKCVPYYQCKNGAIYSGGPELVDNRLKGVCEDDFHTCCRVPDVIGKPEERITPRPKIRRGCGQRYPDGIGTRISGGQDNEPQFGKFPWMVAIYRNQDVNGQKLNFYQCGGSLIHPSVVLTAAHCVVGKSANQLRIRAGEWDTRTKSEVYPYQDRDVANIVIHENYDVGLLGYDFALLHLSEPVKLAENVDVVCLPQENELFDGARCLVSGWGKDIFGKEGHYQKILKSVELPVVPSGICQSNLRTTRLGEYFVLPDSFICAGGESGKDACMGDGGSPLVCPLSNDSTRYAQAGIVAWGIGCGQKNIPGVYANVAAARLWIDQQLALKYYDTNVYSPIRIIMNSSEEHIFI